MAEFTIIYEPAPEGGYAAYIAEISGAVSQGESKEEARELVLESLRELLAFRRDEALRFAPENAILERICLTAGI